jgi:hypothetical protein
MGLGQWPASYLKQQHGIIVHHKKIQKEYTISGKIPMSKNDIV